VTIKSTAALNINVFFSWRAWTEKHSCEEHPSTHGRRKWVARGFAFPLDFEI